MQRYFLAPDVHWCQTPDGIVFLNLKRDRYIGVALSDLPALRTIISGWPAAGDGENLTEASERPSLTDTTSALLSAGLVTMDARRTADVTAASMELPTKSLPDRELDQRPPLRVHHMLNFSRATIRAAVSLKRRPIYQVVERIRDRKQSALALRSPAGDALHDSKLPGSDGVILERLRSLAIVFRLLRVFSYTAREACLLDSLALVEFLARYQLFPQWVFGVQTNPFAAHSWVQHDHYVLNGTVEYVGPYTPLLVV